MRMKIYALLRELKAEIKKLVALVARTVPTIAEGLEKIRSRVLSFCYQILCYANV